MSMPLRRSASPVRRRGSSSEQEQAQKMQPASTSSISQPTQSQQPTPNIDGSATWSMSSFPDDFASSAFPELALMDPGMSNGHPPSQPLNAENLAQFGSMMPPPTRTGSPLSHARSLPNFNFENWDLASSETLSSFAPSQHAFTSFGGPTGLANLGSFSNDMFEPFFRDVFALSSIQETAQDTIPNNNDDLSMDQILSRDPQLHPVVDSFIFSGDSNAQPLDDQLMHDMMVNTYPTPPEAEALDTMPPAPPLFQQQQQQPPAPPVPEVPLSQPTQTQPEPPRPVSTASYPSPPNSLPTPTSSIPEEPAEPTTEELQQYRACLLLFAYLSH